MAGLRCGTDYRGRPGGVSTIEVVERQGEIADRRLDALLERLDKVGRELERLNDRLDRREEQAMIAHELRNLNESLPTLAYAALGQQGPQVRRRRTG